MHSLGNTNLLEQCRKKEGQTIKSWIAQSIISQIAQLWTRSSNLRNNKLYAVISTSCIYLHNCIFSHNTEVITFVLSTSSQHFSLVEMEKAKCAISFSMNSWSFANDQEEYYSFRNLTIPIFSVNCDQNIQVNCYVSGFF